MSYGSEVERNIARAHKLRARFFASLLRQSWAGIKRIARRVGRVPRRTRLDLVDRGETAHSAPPTRLIVPRPNKAP